MIRLRPAHPDDIPFIMETERGSGYERLVGRWEEHQHRAELMKPASAYVIGELNGVPNGFSLLQNLDDPFGNVLLTRIAVHSPGSGFGKAFLTEIVDWAFSRNKTYRLWLDVLVHNERARHVYRSVGFQEEGVLRDAYALPDGTRTSLVLMSILRPEWEGARARSA